MKEIEQFATQFRRAIDLALEAGEFDNDSIYRRFPRACCGDTSDLLAQYLFDFHAYCRKVVHWSLEFNPIKFEQREGRINRYQGYANRLKLAKFMKDKKIKFNGWEDAFEDVRKSQIPEIKELVEKSKGLFPDFVIGDIENEECRLERECYYYPYSFESHEFKNVLICVGYYRTLLGQTGDDKFEVNFQKFIEEIKKRGEIEISDYFIDLYPKNDYTNPFEKKEREKKI